MLFDSMGHNLPYDIKDAEVVMRRGATLWTMISLLQTNEVSVQGRAVVVIAGGTNDLDSENWRGSRDAAEHAQCKMNVLRILVEEIAKQNPSAYIVLCSVLPRPIDDKYTNLCVKVYNRKLRAFAFGHRHGYVPLWSSFVESRPHREPTVPLVSLYTSGMLHLNQAGADKLFLRLQQALSVGSLDAMAVRAVPPFQILW